MVVKSVLDGRYICRGWVTALPDSWVWAKAAVEMRKPAVIIKMADNFFMTELLLYVTLPRAYP
ncbi:MAG TPA: hypothetical protein PLT05_00555 [bacterium]|nr:hypothetical protein [bacterium]